MLNTGRVSSGTVFIVIGLLLSSGEWLNGLVSGQEVATERPNVLFIAIDDLNDWIGCLEGHPQAQTPHLDALAKRGILFTEAHCPAPVCGPARAAIMSGLRPWTTGIYSNNATYPKRLPDVESMPEYLVRQGYHTMGAGKLFHGDTRYPRGAFHEYAPNVPSPWPKEAILSSRQTPTYEWHVDGKVISFPRNGIKADRVWKDTHTFDWGPLDIPDNKFRDWSVVDWSQKKLSLSYDSPFFLGVGIHLPHQPLYAPKRFHDMYPPEEMTLPPFADNDLDDLSQSGRDYALITTTAGAHASVAKHGQWKAAVSSYLATVSFVDFLVGDLLTTLEKSEHAQNTWIVLWSDHGWHLGEKQHWGKATGWYRSTRVPLMIVPPRSVTLKGFKPGQKCDQPVNLIDLFPTIIDMVNLPPEPSLEGRSLLPLVRDPNSDWPDSTVTTFGRGNHAITTRRWRYIQYFDGSAELYDRSVDPQEWTNLIDHPQWQPLARDFQEKVPVEARWKHFIRWTHFKAVIPADGSPMLLFDHSVENHLEERYDESAKHPKVVTLVQKWLAEHPSAPKRIVIPESYR